jgi:ABC-type antimicrobial peptide transport system permease subunit
MVFRESMTLTLAGLAIGVPLIVAAAQLVGALLFDVAATDPTIIAGAMVVLLGVGAASGYLPAWRASRVDPVVALRTE